MASAAIVRPHRRCQYPTEVRMCPLFGKALLAERQGGSLQGGPWRSDAGAGPPGETAPQAQPARPVERSASVLPTGVVLWSFWSLW